MSSDVYRSYTPAERRKRAGLVLRGIKQVIAGADAVDPGLEDRIDTIDARAEDRGAREATALYRQHGQAKDELATARARERAAGRGPERAAAKAARRQAEQQERKAEQAVRRAGLA